MWTEDLAGGVNHRPSWSMRLRHAGRRDVLLWLANGLCAVSGLGIAKALTSYLRPGAPMEPPTRVVLGRRDRVTEGAVLFDKSSKVILVGTPDGIYAMSAVCPHLGCMTSYRSESRLIECACHGSAFTLRGVPLSGPSPPLLWLGGEVNQRNEVVVDNAAVVPAGTMLEERG